MKTIGTCMMIRYKNKTSSYPSDNKKITDTYILLCENKRNYYYLKQQLLSNKHYINNINKIEHKQALYFISEQKNSTDS